MSTREDPQLSKLAPLDETARAPRVKTSVIKQWAGFCPSNGSRTICRNAKDFVRCDPVFSAFRYVRSRVRLTAHDGEPSTHDLGYSARTASSRKPHRFHGCPAMRRPWSESDGSSARVCQSR